MAQKTKFKKKIDGQNIIKSRKELRKEKRKEKKARKHAFFQRKNVVENIHANVNITPVLKSAGEKSQKDDHEKIKSDDLLQKQKNEERKQKLEVKNAKEMQKVRVRQLNEANHLEDKTIKKLEKQLKLNRRKSKTIPKSFMADGLDYLLDICDENTRQQSIAAEHKLFEADSDFEEDFALVAGKLQTKSDKSNVSDGVSKNEENGSDYDSNSIDSENSETEFTESVKIKANFSVVNKGIECSVDSDISDSDLYEDDSEDTNCTMLVKDKKNLSSKLSSKKYKEQSEVEESVTECEEALETLSTLKRKKLNSNKRKRLKTEIDNADNNTEEFKNSSKQLINHVGKKETKRAKKNKKQMLSELDNVVEDPESDDGSPNGKRENIPIEKKVNLLSCNTNVSKDKKIIKKDGNKKVKFRDEVEVNVPLENETSDDEVLNSNTEDDEEEENDDDDNLWEDIYGRTRDNKGNVIQQSSEKYVPPQLRSEKMLDSKKRENLLRLKKQIKGLLNRLAESNMSSIASQIEDLYMNNSRNDMNETLTSCIMESLISPTLTPERLIMEHCTLITILHANVGTEIGAHFLQSLVKKFDEMFKLNCEVEEKQIDNAVLIISHLYNFKLFHSTLMYDILETLSEAFKEKEIELILLILRSVGFTLRKDDPIALKNLILNLQKKAASAPHNNSRIKFMLDVLLAVKNNNMSKIPNYDPSHSEHLKKILRSFLRKGNFVTELNISLVDLLKAEERGRWWIVGSAWTGPVPGEDNLHEPKKSNVNATKYSQQLLDLARKQRMNTDVRRNIFCILMSAEDYLDAFEKLLHLGLKNLQEREIIYVVIDCCLQEKEFNPYYAYVAQKFCDFDRKYQMTLQFYLWDKLKELQSLTLQQTRNLAKFTTQLIMDKGLPISVLKIIQFTDVDKPTVRFLRLVLLGILLHKSEENCLQVFQRVAVAPKLATFRESLRLFIHHFLLRNTTALISEEVTLLKERAKNADKVLSISRSHLD